MIKRVKFFCSNNKSISEPCHTESGDSTKEPFISSGKSDTEDIHDLLPMIPMLIMGFLIFLYFVYEAIFDTQRRIKLRRVSPELLPNRKVVKVVNASTNRRSI